MISNGNTVKIVYSIQLQDNKLLFLAGQTGTVTECLFKHRRNPGAFVTITKGRNIGEEWFIPLRSLQTRETVNRMRNEVVLRSLLN